MLDRKFYWLIFCSGFNVRQCVLNCSGVLEFEGKMLMQFEKNEGGFPHLALLKI